jgi:hypothetical protein
LPLRLLCTVFVFNYCDWIRHKPRSRLLYFNNLSPLLMRVSFFLLPLSSSTNPCASSR